MGNPAALVGGGGGEGARARSLSGAAAAGWVRAPLPSHPHMCVCAWNAPPKPPGASGQRGGGNIAWIALQRGAASPEPWLCPPGGRPVSRHCGSPGRQRLRGPLSHQRRYMLGDRASGNKSGIIQSGVSAWWRSSLRWGVGVGGGVRPADGRRVGARGAFLVRRGRRSWAWALRATPATRVPDPCGGCPTRPDRWPMLPKRRIPRKLSGGGRGGPE